MFNTYLFCRYRSHLLRITICAMISFLSITSHISAQVADTINTSVIVGSRKPSNINQSAPLQVIEKGEIQKLGINDVYEAVRLFSGVSIKDYGGIGGLKTVSIRSMGSQHTAIIYDGISISNAQNGQIDIGRFSLNNIENISVSIGQIDDIYKCAREFASAGVLNIKSSTPIFTDHSANISAQMKYGSFDTYNPQILYEQKLSDKWSLNIAGEWLKSKGSYPFILSNGSTETEKIRKNSDVNTWKTEFNVFGKIGKGNIRIKGNYYDSERGLPGSVVLYNDDANERLWDKTAFGDISYDNKIGEKIKIGARINYNYTWNKYLDINARYPSGKQEDRYTQNEYYGSVFAKYSPLEYLHFSIGEDFFVNTLDATLPDCPFPTRYTTLTSLAAQFRNKRWIATASLLGTYLTERVKIGEASGDKWRLSPAASISFKLLEDKEFMIRASYKDIFRVPTFNDLYYSRVGNRNIKPEKATQYNLGLTWRDSFREYTIDNISVTVDGYFNKIKDKIVAIPTMFIWKMMNFGEVNIAGADINFYINLLFSHRLSLSISANYTYQYAIDVTDPNSKNYRHQIPYTPRHSGNGTISFSNPWINFSYILSAVGKRYSFPQNIDNNLITGYFDHTISANHTFNIGKCKLHIQGDIANIGNVNYEVIQFYPMAGRNYKISLKFIY